MVHISYGWHRLKNPDRIHDCCNGACSCVQGRTLFASKELIRAPFLPKQTSMDQKDSLDAFKLVSNSTVYTMHWEQTTVYTAAVMWTALSPPVILSQVQIMRHLLWLMPHYSGSPIEHNYTWLDFRCETPYKSMFSCICIYIYIYMFVRVHLYIHSRSGDLAVACWTAKREVRGWNSCLDRDVCSMRNPGGRRVVDKIWCMVLYHSKSWLVLSL